MRALPIAFILAFAAAAPAHAAGRKTCKAFATYAEAQAFCASIRAESPSCKGLDRDKDGSACESLPGGPKAKGRKAAPAPSPKGK